ncbi:MAG: hypothetical protein QOH95_901, partial [Gaiellaceae bacterium]|nr:hypothetical protein [Gaiellaceae bacterium]
FRGQRDGGGHGATSTTEPAVEG